MLANATSQEVMFLSWKMQGRKCKRSAMQAASSFPFHQMKTESLTAAALLSLQGLVHIPRNTMLRKGGLVASGHPTSFHGRARLAKGLSIGNT